VDIKTLNLEPGDEILVPAYNHDLPIKALIQTGSVCCFYDIRQRLQPD
jgi:hypothetical protein